MVRRGKAMMRRGGGDLMRAMNKGCRREAITGAQTGLRRAVAVASAAQAGAIVAVNVSAQKGMKKKSVPGVRLVAGFGIEGDAHAGSSVRQVSLLSVESIKKMNKRGLELGPGDFAENLTTKGIDFSSVKIGDRLRIGNDAIIEISQIGKVCHERCAIYHQAGDCVMPREGVFARVIEGGFVASGDEIKKLKDEGRGTRDEGRGTKDGPRDDGLRGCHSERF